MTASVYPQVSLTLKGGDNTVHMGAEIHLRVMLTIVTQNKG